MTQLPDELCALDCADGLAVVQPLDHPFGVPCRTGRSVVRLARLFLDEEMPVPPWLGWASLVCFANFGHDIIWLV